MRFLLSCLLSLVLAAGTAAAEEKMPVELKTDNQKLSYALGLDLGDYFKNLGEEIDLDIMHQGVVDAYKGNKPQLSAEDAAEIQQKFAQQIKEKQQEEMAKQTAEMIAKNRKEAEEFLKENAAREEVKTTDSGLQYIVLEEGEGMPPQMDDTVKVHYVGTLLDGTEFDSSYSRNEAAVFPVNRVIPGWIEALQMMKPGSKYKIFLPPDLAYGDRGAPPVIEPGSLLVFEVELLDVLKDEQDQQQ
jgi:FKBP-type peptidyl-prolyl cis-trans isomerase